MSEIQEASVYFCPTELKYETSGDLQTLSGVCLLLKQLHSVRPCWDPKRILLNFKDELGGSTAHLFGLLEMERLLGNVLYGCLDDFSSKLHKAI